ncbi:uncharacterized protein [Diadema antillarum]|uniref:uncharacterized protein n=1 Tax=Diadema antillarum TaxID=105358 RepID=UPI003A8632B1
MAETESFPRINDDVNQWDDKGYSRFHNAIKSGNVDQVQRLYSSGVDVSIRTRCGLSALHIAVLYCEQGMLKLLIDCGANIDARITDDIDNENFVGATPVYLAALEGKLDMVQYLLSKGSRFDKRNKEGRKAIHVAAGKGHQHVVECLLDWCRENNLDDKLGIKSVDGEGRKPIHYAAERDQLDVFKCLINRGSEDSERDDKGTTPLLLASRHGSTTIVKYLLSVGCNVNQQNNKKYRAIHCASKHGHLEIVKLLVEAGSGVSEPTGSGDRPLHYASKYGHFPIVRRLTNAGAHVNAVRGNGMTPIHLAAQNGNLEIVTHLIHKGSTFTKRDKKGKAPLCYASEHAHLEVVEYLLMKEAEFREEKIAGLEPIHLASRIGNIRAVKFFVEKDESLVDAPDDKGWIPLYHASDCDHPEVVQYLLQHRSYGIVEASRVGCLAVLKYLISKKKAKFDEKDNTGQQALHHASAKGHVQVVEYLVSQGADITAPAKDGKTPLHMAAQSNYHAVVRLLLKCTASISKIETATLVNHPDEDGHTPLHLAVKKGCTSVVELLLEYEADVNVKSHDGSCCLHSAVKLCSWPENGVEATEETKKVSEKLKKEHGKEEIHPGATLVHLLLSHKRSNGANILEKDKLGNIPCQYAGDEVIRQMIMSKFLEQGKCEKEDCLEPGRWEATSLLEPFRVPKTLRRSLESTIGRDGGTLFLEDHDMTAIIPAGAVEEEDASVSLSVEPPSSPPAEYKPKEPLACYGVIRLYSTSTVHFNHPVKIRFPHSAEIVRPEDVRPIIVSRNPKDGSIQSREATDSSTRPYCKVDEHHFELFVDCCADWWILIRLKKDVARKQLVCTPYIPQPESLERDKKYTIRLHFHDNTERSRAEEKETANHFRAAHGPLKLGVELNAENVVISCKQGDQNEKVITTHEPHVLCESKTHMETINVIPSQRDSELIVLKISQGNCSSHEIAFLVCYKGTQFKEEPCESVCEDAPDYVKIVELAAEIDIDDYYDVGVALGLTIPQLDSIEYRRLRNREEANLDVLLRWTREYNGPNPYKTLVKVINSLKEKAEISIEGVNVDPIHGDIGHDVLVNLARQIDPQSFWDIGKQLGLPEITLRHIQYSHPLVRKDANVKMLWRWYRSHDMTGSEAIDVIRKVMASAKNASKAKGKTKVEERTQNRSSEHPTEADADQSTETGEPSKPAGGGVCDEQHPASDDAADDKNTEDGMDDEEEDERSDDGIRTGVIPGEEVDNDTEGECDAQRVTEPNAMNGHDGGKNGSVREFGTINGIADEADKPEGIPETVRVMNEALVGSGKYLEEKTNATREDDMNGNNSQIDGIPNANVEISTGAEQTEMGNDASMVKLVAHSVCCEENGNADNDACPSSMSDEDNGTERCEEDYSAGNNERDEGNKSLVSSDTQVQEPFCTRKTTTDEENISEAVKESAGSRSTYCSRLLPRLMCYFMDLINKDIHRIVD